MTLRIKVVAPVLVSTLLLPVLAFAAPDDDAAATVEIEGDAAIEIGADPAVSPEAVEAPAAAETPVDAPLVDPPRELSETEITAIEAVLATDIGSDMEPIEDESYSYEEEWEEDWEYESSRTVLELQSGYFGVGIAPGMTIHDRGFHPNTRFELEFGGTLEHDFRDLGWSFGVVSHVTPYYGRKKPSFGADVTSTAMLGPIYIRTGLGALGGLPRNHQLENTAAAIGGVIGAGLNFGRAPMVRIGVDYDFRVTTKLEPIHTVFIALRVACCRSE